jgi:Fe-S-cluster containining protein
MAVARTSDYLCIESLISSVEEIYQEADRDTRRFQVEAGISCPTGCGSCCESHQVEATILEALPMAASVIRDGSLNAIYDLLKEKAERDDPVCVFFVKLGKDVGCCSRYAVRPLVCRLFGFAGRIGKAGLPEFSPCRRIKESFPHQASLAVKAVSRGYRIPIFSHFFTRVSSIYPLLGMKTMPINEAFRSAIDYAGLRIGL